MVVEDFPAAGVAAEEAAAGRAYFLAFLVSSFSISTASREMFLRRWRKKNQMNINMEQPNINRPYLTRSGQLVAKRINALAMPRHIVYRYLRARTIFLASGKFFLVREFGVQLSGWPRNLP